MGAMGFGFTLNLITRYDYKLYTPLGTEIRLGGPDNLVRKVIAAASVERYAHAQKMRPQYVDVRVPGDVRWRPAAAVVPTASPQKSKGTRGHG